MNAGHWIMSLHDSVVATWCDAIRERVNAMTDKLVGEIAYRRGKSRSVNCEIVASRKF